MFSTAIIQCISIFHFKWNKFFTISPSVFTSLSFFMELRNETYSLAFFLNVAILHLLVCCRRLKKKHIRIEFIQCLQYLKSYLVNFVLSRGSLNGLFGWWEEQIGRDRKWRRRLKYQVQYYVIYKHQITRHENNWTANAEYSAFNTI